MVGWIASSQWSIFGYELVYHLKLHVDGYIDWYKAFLVGKGYHQTQGLDYLETFSLVVKAGTIRVVLHLAVSKDWSIHQFLCIKCFPLWIFF